MKVTSSYKRCPKCKTMNVNVDVCTVCEEVLSFKKKHEQKVRKVLEEQVAIIKYEKENPNWVQRLKKNRFLLLRIFGHIIYSVVFIVSLIGSLLAWIIAMVLAG